MTTNFTPQGYPLLAVDRDNRPWHVVGWVRSEGDPQMHPVAVPANVPGDATYRSGHGTVLLAGPLFFQEPYRSGCTCS